MWIQKGIIEPANSPWALLLVPVKKKDGRTRWVTDLRQHQSIWYILAHKDGIQSFFSGSKLTFKDKYCLNCSGVKVLATNRPSGSSIYRKL